MTQLRKGAAAFELARGWRIALISAKRWKATRKGVERLGELTGTARAFTSENGVRVLEAAELA